jgi:hypothetical protein
MITVLHYILGSDDGLVLHTMFYYNCCRPQSSATILSIMIMSTLGKPSWEKKWPSETREPVRQDKQIQRFQPPQKCLRLPTLKFCSRTTHCSCVLIGFPPSQLEKESVTTVKFEHLAAVCCNSVNWIFGEVRQKYVGLYAVRRNSASLSPQQRESSSSGLPISQGVSVKMICTVLYLYDL